MKKSIEHAKELHFEKTLKLEDIPDLDLYMDQVIQLFDKTYSQNKRNEEEKILTKTMINNYAKGKILPPITNKKYSKNHLILMNFIYELKGSLSLTDIKQTLGAWKQKAEEGNSTLDESYNTYLKLHSENVEYFYGELQEIEAKIEDVVKRVDTLDNAQLQQTMLILSYIHMSNLYRKTAEKLIDELAFETQEEENIKNKKGEKS
ncbi:DUF1836 domain-containing protein [Alkalihalobacillus pseudalcaliphilus]|uniref:DUF1836 domain-containing protein n=1 Tax=Alkalihalobacillus pseudalcaliphilus TaxID=79884 RepID=UPI00064DFDA6|nr:DUF1836 domain-containing protein [Alkalihalobacillus pseudalcaliphilus]KMK77731.1 hypothetical protein AB990_04555 [Alkalihalobacillus pseudalcaliphilus]